MTETSGSRIEGFGNLMFSLSVSSWGGSMFSGVQMGGILWQSVKEPVAVRAFLEQVIETYRDSDRMGIRPSQVEA